MSSQLYLRENDFLALATLPQSQWFLPQERSSGLTFSLTFCLRKVLLS